MSTIQKILLISLFILPGCSMLPMGIPIKSYKINSLSEFKNESHNKKIKIYLVAQDKRNYERNSNKSINVSNYCASGSGYHSYDSPIVIEDIWKVVENKAFDVAQNNDLPLAFVCSSKEADYIFEYSFNQTMPYGSITMVATLPFHIALLGIPPFVNNYKYDLFLNVIDAKTNSIARSGNEEFAHTTVLSSVLLPFSPLIEPEENNLRNIQLDTMAKMVVDKTLIYSKDLPH